MFSTFSHERTEVIGEVTVCLKSHGQVRGGADLTMGRFDSQAHGLHNYTIISLLLVQHLLIPI